MILFPLLLTGLPFVSAHQESEAPGLHDRTAQAVGAYWQEAARALRTKHGVAEMLPRDEDAHRLRVKLEGTRLDGLHLEDVESLGEALAPVAALAGVPIAVDPRATQVMLDEGLVISVHWSHPVSVSTVLDVIAELAGEEVAWTVRDGAVLFATREGIRGERLVHLHPVGDLLQLFDLDELAVTVMETAAPETWDEEGVYIEPTGAFLLVTHTRDAQLQVERHLDHLRAFQASLAARPTFEPGPAEHARAAALVELEGVRLAADFRGNGEGVHLAAAALFLQELSGVNFLVDRIVFDELDEEVTRLDFDLGKTSVRGALDGIVLRRPDLAWTYEGGVVRITARHDGGATPVFALYDVRAITRPVGPPIAPLHDGHEDDDLTPLVLSADVLEELIRTTIDPESWDVDPRHALRIGDDGILWVHQSPRALSELRALLGRLQGIADTLLDVAARRR